jgi:glycosyltransferase involved in cell wall biosynthesis
MMQVLTLVPNQKGHSPGQRGSIELWEKVLAPAGIELVYAPFETAELREILYRSGHHLAKTREMLRGYASRLGVLNTLDDYDAVFIYREAALLGPAFLEKRIARRKPIIYQLDDPLFVPYRSPSNGYLSYLKFFGKIKEIIRISRVVIANSSQIREYARQFNADVRQIPSVVDTERYVYRPFPAHLEMVTIGWSGSPSTLGNLALVEQPLRAVSQAGICGIHFIGGTDFALRGVRYSAQMWNSATEVEDLRKIQIGLVPLPDSPWNRYKFIMKTAQYMALGIVPVGTPMASNTEVIRHGENGFLAATDAEWQERLTELVRNDALRNRMSAAAAADAIAKYSLQAHTAQIIDAFKSAIRR